MGAGFLICTDSGGAEYRMQCGGNLCVCWESFLLMIQDEVIAVYDTRCDPERPLANSEIKCRYLYLVQLIKLVPTQSVPASSYITAPD